MQGGLENVVNMFIYLVRECFGPEALQPPPTADTASPPPPTAAGMLRAAAAAAKAPQPGAVVETPATGCYHPAYPGKYFAGPAEFMRWYEGAGAVRGTAAPTVAVLLYRKHIITAQPYIDELIDALEAEGIRPIPIFINGVEAHTVVRSARASVCVCVCVGGVPRSWILLLCKPCPACWETHDALGSMHTMHARSNTRCARCG
jgi:magnesium chelatase subunit H